MNFGEMYTKSLKFSQEISWSWYGNVHENIQVILDGSFKAIGELLWIKFCMEGSYSYVQLVKFDWFRYVLKKESTNFASLV